MVQMGIEYLWGVMETLLVMGRVCHFGGEKVELCLRNAHCNANHQPKGHQKGTKTPPQAPKSLADRSYYR